MDSNSVPDWQDFFTFVGLVAGGLTGLIFVALSIHVTEVTARSAYIARARTTLGALTGFLVLCGLALIPGQTPRAFGLECLVLFVILIGDIVQHFRDFEAPGGRRNDRWWSGRRSRSCCSASEPRARSVC